MKRFMIAVAAALAAGVALAETSFSYQGALRSGNGEPLVQKDHVIMFRLYTDPTAESPLWARKVAVHLDDEGLFNVELSDGVSPAPQGITNLLADVLAATSGEGLYIGLDVENSSGEIRPRQKLLPVPVSSFAQDVRTARMDFSVVGQATFEKNVVAKGDLSVEGTTTVAGLSVGNGITVSGNTTIGGSLKLDKTSNLLVDGNPLLPSGIIVMWSGAADKVPGGWLLCDGKDGLTPDLRDRFIVGAGKNYSVRDQGGAESVALTTEEMPRHSHSYEYKAYDLAAAWQNNAYFYAVSKGDNWKSASTLSAGGREDKSTKPHENRPPYFALCFIMKK